MSSVFFVRIHVWLKMAMLLSLPTTGRRGARVTSSDNRFSRSYGGGFDIIDYEMKADTMLQTLQGYQYTNQGQDARGDSTDYLRQQEASRESRLGTIHTYATAKRQHLVDVFICLRAMPRTG